MFKYTETDLIPIWKSEHNLSGFTSFLKSKWNELHEEPNVFRYKITNLQDRYLENNYLLQLNPDRGVKRRFPEEITNICQPVDPKKFNFTKVSAKEIMFRIFKDDKDDDNHQFIVNVSPISRYHTLFCPSVNKCLPQVATKESQQMAIEIMFLAQDRDLRIAFNSLCALASVNHLHYHLLWLKETIPVEKIKCHLLKGSLHYFDPTYPVPAFCFQIQNADSIKPITDNIYKLITYLLDKHIAHNVLISRGDSFECVGEVVRVCVWPRKSSNGVKHLGAFNVASYELAGYFVCYVPDDFNKLQTSDIDAELRKWRYESFEELCDEVKSIF